MRVGEFVKDAAIFVGSLVVGSVVGVFLLSVTIMASPVGWIIAIVGGVYFLWNAGVFG